MSGIRNFFANLYDMSSSEKNRWRRMLVNVLRFLNELRIQFAKDTVVVRASGMAYTTLLAIVPLMAVLFSVMSAFSQFAAFKDQVQAWLFSQIVPAKSGEILAYINQFTANTKTLGAFSALFLLITSIMLFDNIEKNFNALWNVTKQRGMMSRFMTFTNVLLWGPILFAMSFLVSGKLRAILNDNPLIEVGFLTRFMFGILPYLFTVFAFMLMLKVIPATKVKIRSAMVGGVVGGALWEIGKIVFTHTTAKSITYNAVYGSLALVPIFLVWLYITWVIVLLAVEISYVHHNYYTLVLNRAFVRPSAREKVHLAVRVLVFVARRFHAGQGPATLTELEDRFRIPNELAEQLIDQLMRGGLIQAVECEVEDDMRFVPGKSLDVLRLGEVVVAVYQDGAGAEPERGLDRLDKLAVDILENGERAATEEYEKTTILELIARSDQDLPPDFGDA
ncbi:MAG: YihY family inner membrane protein [Candidatus Lernaella stagnicola]|nr:YihY family inner membrane protein [Candidatus Lernaella stagnicola]